MPETDRISFLTLSSAGSLLDFLLCAWKGIRVVKGDMLKAQGLKALVQDQWRRQRLAQYEQETCDETWLERFRERFAYTYPRDLAGLYTKTTVSELKLEKMAEASEGARHLFTPREEAYIPRFCTKEEKLSGAARGSAFHRAMELLDFGAFPRTDSREQLTQWVETCVNAFLEQGKMTEAERDCIEPDKIADFLLTETAHRMQAAAAGGLLKKEQPFMLGLSASRVKPEFPNRETVLIQGIIDVYWEEAGELVVLDYKTDRVRQAVIQK